MELNLVSSDNIYQNEVKDSFYNHSAGWVWTLTTEICHIEKRLIPEIRYDRLSFGTSTVLT
jgi:hypothetical protein